MNILNDIVSGASRQFGREFGRAGANTILKGANSYTVREISNYSGRIKPSDSQIIKAIKEIQKVKFVSTNKANASRLIDITDLMLSNISFTGNETLNQLTDLNELVNQYNNKFDHGSSLIDDDFKDKSIDYLEDKRNEFVALMDKFNNETKVFINGNLELAKQKRKSKKTTTILAFPILGSLGIHKFYLGQIGQGILYFMFSFLLIPAIISLFEFISYLSMSTEKFDTKFNPEYSYYNQFRITN
ncbi:MAG: TM2 domain-containing protein [Algibacter sp.]|uniref:TM2 domain-containing protein n=1 Tax=Algibacter sp. TaxID=1872428 RepID=UPI002635C6B7|nr:TM2 domain-containing protein [Algibacter sp.]MDG1729824.1 TM2 domain-containing protein [Algibacter sp.]MDG2177978.1 TM2 domain-containing protein [Algibacter sp.]